MKRGRLLALCSALLALGCGTEPKKRGEPSTVGGGGVPGSSVELPSGGRASAEAHEAAEAAVARKRAELAARSEAKKGKVLGASLEAPAALALDAEAAFVALVKKGEVIRVPLGAKGERLVLATGLALETPAHEAALVDAGDDVLLLTSGTEAGVFEDGALVRVAKAGGAPKLVQTKLRRASNLVSAGGRVAFATAADPGKRPPAVWLGSATAVTKYWSPEGNEGALCALALDATHLYVVERLSEAETRIVRFPLPATAPDGPRDAKRPKGGKGEDREKPAADEVLARGTEVDCALAILGDELFFPSARGSVVKKLSKAGGDVKLAANVKTMGRVVALAAGDGAVFGLAVQPAGSISAQGAILRMTSTSFEWVATEEGGLQNLAVGPKGPAWTRWLELEQDGAVVGLP